MDADTEMCWMWTGSVEPIDAGVSRKRRTRRHSDKLRAGQGTLGAAELASQFLKINFGKRRWK